MDLLCPQQCPFNFTCCSKTCKGKLKGPPLIFQSPSLSYCFYSSYYLSLDGLTTFNTKVVLSLVIMFRIVTMQFDLGSCFLLTSLLMLALDLFLVQKIIKLLDTLMKDVSSYFNWFYLKDERGFQPPKLFQLMFTSCNFECFILPHLIPLFQLSLLIALMITFKGRIGYKCSFFNLIIVLIESASLFLWFLEEMNLSLLFSLMFLLEYHLTLARMSLTWLRDLMQLCQGMKEEDIKGKWFFKHIIK